MFHSPRARACPRWERRSAPSPCPQDPGRWSWEGKARSPQDSPPPPWQRQSGTLARAPRAIRPMPWVAGLETGNGGRGRGWAAAVGGGRGRGSSQSPWFASGQRGSIWRSGRGRAFRTRGGRRGRY